MNDMNKNNNSRVPVAILCCFLVAFIIQGVLKLCGVFIFEKSLSWGIFNIIDNTLWLYIVYYSLIVFVTIYCLSFMLTSEPYSRKWYHYIILLIISFGITTLKTLVAFDYKIHILFDILVYIIVPLVINFTTNAKYKLLGNSMFEIITTISMQIGMYFCFLGLQYWSVALNSILPINMLYIPASASFLIKFEVYIGLVCIMLSMNMLTKKIKRR